jgi:hypothetical protein
MTKKDSSRPSSRGPQGTRDTNWYRGQLFMLLVREHARSEGGVDNI